MTPEDGDDLEMAAVAVGILVNLYPSRADIGPAQLEQVARMVRSMNRERMNDEKMDRLQQDVSFLVEHHWDTLNERGNRRRTAELVRRLLT